MATGRAAAVSADIRWMAASEYLVDYDDAHKERLQRCHRRAIPYFKSLTKTELKSMLAPLATATDAAPVWRASAAYVLALHGVDVDKNVRTIRRVSDALLEDPDPWDVAQSAPEAIGDVYRRFGGVAAARDLVAMKIGDLDSENQGFEIEKAFSRDPEPFMNAMQAEPVLRPKFVELLGFGEFELRDTEPAVKSRPGIRKLRAMSQWAKQAAQLNADLDRYLH